MLCLVWLDKNVHLMGLGVEKPRVALVTVPFGFGDEEF